MSDGMGSLRANVDELLQHQQGPDPLRPDVVVVGSAADGYAVVVVVDGYYATEELAVDAATGWREVLGWVLADLAADREEVEPS